MPFGAVSITFRNFAVLIGGFPATAGYVCVLIRTHSRGIRQLQPPPRLLRAAQADRARVRSFFYFFYFLCFSGFSGFLIGPFVFLVSVTAS